MLQMLVRSAASPRQRLQKEVSAAFSEEAERSELPKESTCGWVGGWMQVRAGSHVLDARNRGVSRFQTFMKRVAV